MKKRDFLKATGILALGTVAGPLVSCGGDSPKPDPDPLPNLNPEKLVVELPKLNYGYDALAPKIDAQTVEIHYSKHHQGYTNKFNKAMEGEAAVKFAGMDLEKVLANIGDDDTAFRNNGGGYYNHCLYWDTMAPAAQAVALGGDLESAINASFTSFDSFKEQFSAAAKGRFGSGWAWLSVGADKKLFISSTANQDNPLMTKVTEVEQKGTPILGIDVWEHAYYLNYQNRRGDYITAFYDLINWGKVGELFKTAVG